MVNTLHMPPAVAYPLKHQQWLNAAVWCLFAFAVVLWGAWRVAQPMLLGVQVLAMWLLIVAGVGLWRWLQSLPRTTLYWQQGHWQIAGIPLRGVVLNSTCRVVVDAQACLLLYVEQQSSLGRTSHWVWLQRDSAPEQWRALRQAVVWSHQHPCAVLRVGA